MNDEKKPNETERKAPLPLPPETPPAEPGAPKKAPFVFKILPADPKNAFDFEDVADK